MSALGIAWNLTLPLMIAGSLHMVVVKKDIGSALRIPIHSKFFGANKTWRGLLVMPAFSSVITLLMSQLGLAPFDSLTPTQALGVGIISGLIYILSELPNSALKRKLGIQPGKLPVKNKLPFLILDQSDSAIGCALAYGLLFPQIPPLGWLTCALLGPVLHLLVNLALFLLGLRKEPV